MCEPKNSILSFNLEIIIERARAQGLDKLLHDQAQAQPTPWGYCVEESDNDNLVMDSIPPLELDSL